MKEKNVSVKMKKTMEKYALTGIRIAILVLSCFAVANFIGPESEYVFLVNVLAASAILCFIVKMVYKRIYAEYGKKILYVTTVVVAANHLYLYENVVQMFPALAHINKGTILLFLLLTFGVTFLIGCLVRYVSDSDGSDKMTGTMEKDNVYTKASGHVNITPKHKSVKQQDINRQEGNNTRLSSVIAKVVGVLLTAVAIGVSFWLYFKLELPKLISDNPIENLSSFVSSLIGYIASILFVLFAIALVLIALVEVLRVLFQRIKLLRKLKKGEEDEDNSALAFAFSILLVFAALILTYKVSDLTLMHVADELVAGDYLALPLVVLVGIVVVILILRVTYGILLLLMKPNPLPSREDLKKFTEVTQIKQYTVEIGCLIIKTVLGTIKSVLSFVEFVPDFFTTLGVLVVPNKEKEDKETDTSPQEDKGIRIVTIAAFCFALVSFVATANGLNNYVFTEAGQRYQAYLISFGIQSILFVFNLKLPSYFAYIGSLVPDAQKKKNRRGKYKWTRMQKVISVFYAVVICSSSIFSYVYIANAVYAKTRYDDANIVLDNRYRIIADDTEKYINEEINYNRLHIAKQLGELQDLMPGNNTIKKSKAELQTEKIQAEKTLADRKTEQETAQADFDAAWAKYSRTLSLQSLSESQINKDKRAYNSAKERLKTAKEATNAAEEALAKVELELANFKPTASTVVRDFLIEMLQPTPSIEDYEKDGITYLGLNSYIKQLNDCVLKIDEEGIDMVNFSKIVSKASELSISVENYITYTKAQAKTVEEKTITIPIYGDNDYEKQVIEWEQEWRKRFGNLEETVKSLPEYAEASSLDKGEFGDVVNFEILSEFQSHEIVNEIDDLQRKNFSTINHFERAGNLLVSEYPFLAWFSLGLAFFLDVASLLAGLFIYYISRKNNTKES